MFYLLLLRIGYTNRYYVVSVISTFVLLRLCIGYTNRYTVVGVTQVFYLLRLRNCHTNRYVVASVMPVLFLLRLHSYLNSSVALDNGLRHLLYVGGRKLVYQCIVIRV